MSKKYTDNHSSKDPKILSPINDEGFSDFLDHLFDKTPKDTLFSLTLPIESIDPLACLEQLDDGKSFQFFWEKPGDAFALAAGKSLVELKANGTSRFQKISAQISAIKDKALEYSTLSHSHSGIHFLGGFSFFDENNSPEWSSFGAASFTVPEWQIIKEGRLTLLTLNFKVSAFENRHHLEEEIEEKLQHMGHILELNSTGKQYTNGEHTSIPKSADNKEAFIQWSKSVSIARKLIRDNKFEKIVLARKASVELQEHLEPTHIVNNLREKYPDCYTFLIRPHAQKTFLGSTPERLVSFKKNYVLTEALAGSMRRGGTATEDAVLERALLKSSKNASEHNYVVKAIEQRLKSLVKKMEKDSKPVIKKLSNVQHLFTPITAWLKKSTDPLAVLEQLHPTPAVGGYPWKKAAPYLSELEHFDRGWYAGPVGWLNSKDGGEFAVAIRSGLINENCAHFYAGCGIVADSDAETEWRETILKLSPMLSAL